MVKRQTVWLSTMMVLSLMLIGYYTMSNQSATTSTDNGAGGPTVTTSVNTPGSTGLPTGTTPSTSQGHTGQAVSGGQSNQQQTASQTTSQSSNSNDWFIGQQTLLDQHMSEQISNLQAVIANNNASTDAIGQAEQSLQKLENLKGNLAEARDAIIGDGFKECVIVPTATNAQMQVYVKASALASSDVIKIMNIVSQQLDIPMVNVVVTTHA